LIQKNFTWPSENEKIDDFIYISNINYDKNFMNHKNAKDLIFEWIPYNQLNEIKEMGNDNNITIYSAIWKDGPLYYNYNKEEYTRDPNKEVTLRCLQNSQNTIELIMAEVLISSSIFIFFLIKFINSYYLYFRLKNI
jgi:hypothetical protein